ncbi:MAG TPA: sugar ABC transporter ATP-binding protein [Solirubrobacterales bacterium]|nr:sugar ABC transporter ATP-binding protein [Solirubrobacterales bacterium]
MTDEQGLVANRVSKSFYGNRVLHDLDLTIPGGTVHALLGHNGSGKSTFIKILAGFYMPDKGSGPVTVGSHELEFGNPDSTYEAGITFVHQSLGLVPTLSVLENLRLGKSWTTNFMKKISWGKERRLARESLERFGLGTHPDTMVGELSTVEQTEVAIVRALSEGDHIRILVLDEPTAALTDHEVKKLFSTLERVKERGVGVLYVTHRLEEIRQIADEVTVLSDGRTVGHGPVDDFPQERLVRLIAGTTDSPTVTAPRPDSSPVAAAVGTGAPLLKVKGLRVGELVDGEFEGRAGEIVGAVGLLGSGILDLARVLTGRLKLEAGSVELDGEPVDPFKFARMTNRGLGAVVGQRPDRVAMSLTVQENLTLEVLPDFMRHGILNRRAETRSAVEAIERFNIRCAGPAVEMATLSGGNQQKSAIAKVLQAEPKVLVLEEPCHGVDASGREEIGAMLRTAAAEGTLVLVIDSDLDEVVGLCNRVLVFRDGKVVGQFQEEELSRSQLLDASYGSNN